MAVDEFSHTLVDPMVNLRDPQSWDLCRQRRSWKRARGGKGSNACHCQDDIWLHRYIRPVDLDHGLELACGECTKRNNRAQELWSIT